MGKEWYWGGGGRSSKRGGSDISSGGGGCMCAVFQAFDFHPFHFSINHQQQPPTHKSPSRISQDLPTGSVPKGAEAPRNSLESDDGTASHISKDEDLKIPKNIRIKTRRSKKLRAGNLSDVSSEISISSPGTKTPTLVARLMGLDLLPDAHSSSSSSSSCLSTPNQQQGNNPPHLHNLKPRKQHIQILRHRNSTDNIGTIRSLPETPRMSLARRSDVEHRLSLQINKENVGLGEDLEPPRFSFSNRKYDENTYSRSPSHYARQIVKQVKESVSRKVGLDITNTVNNREHQAREEFVRQFRFKKCTKKSSVDESSPGKNSNSSYSPRLSRFVDTTKHKPNTKPSSSPLAPKDQNTHPHPVVVLKPLSSPPPVANIETQLSSRALAKPKPQEIPEKESQSQKPVPKCKKITTNENFSSRLNKAPPQTSIKRKQEESFVTRPPPSSPTSRANDIKAKSKRTHPISGNLLINNVPNVLPVKTDPSPPATKLPQKQVCDSQEPKTRIARLSSCSRQKYKQEATHTLATRGTKYGQENKSNSVSTTTTTTIRPNDEEAEFQYITNILTRTGLRKATLPNLQFQWFSLSHPLDASVFHNIENNYPSSNSSLSSPGDDKDCIFKQKEQLGLRCNRRLLFDLVGELLSEILVRPKCHKAGLLLETVVWKRVRSFPRAKCEVLEDIDGLIEMEDMKSKMKEEEGEQGLVVEIGTGILETLVHETVTVMAGA